MKIRKQVSDAKLKANIDNAQNSCGPSERGKGFSKRNALTYGIFSQMLVAGETTEELEELWEETLKRRIPVVGSDEYTQVEIIFDQKVRLRRLRRAMAGETNKELARRKLEDDFTARMANPKYQQAVTDLAKLKQVQEEVEAKGRMSAENVQWLKTLAYEPVDVLVELIQQMQARMDEGEDKSLAGSTSPPDGDESEEAETVATVDESDQPDETETTVTEYEKRAFFRELILPALDDLKTTLERAKLHYDLESVSRFTAEQNALLVPQDAVMARFDRYE